MGGIIINTKFISERITDLRIKKDISERELSISLGKTDNYINKITSGKSLPSMESFLEICNYFEITPFEFSYSNINDPITSKKIYDEMKRLSKNNLSEFLLILETLNPSDYSAFLSFMNRYKWNKDHKI